MFKSLIIFAIAFTICSFKGSASTTEFYFFELESLKADMPYYFSQVISIQYTDIRNLEQQKSRYVRELKTEAANDRLDTVNYRAYISGAADNKIHCQNLQNSAQATLTAAGKKFINRDIHL